MIKKLFANNFNLVFLITTIIENYILIYLEDYRYVEVKFNRGFCKISKDMSVKVSLHLINWKSVNCEFEDILLRVMLGRWWEKSKSLALSSSMTQSTLWVKVRGDSRLAKSLRCRHVELGDVTMTQTRTNRTPKYFTETRYIFVNRLNYIDYYIFTQIYIVRTNRLVGWKFDSDIQFHCLSHSAYIVDIEYW